METRARADPARSIFDRGEQYCTCGRATAIRRSKVKDGGALNLVFMQFDALLWYADPITAAEHRHRYWIGAYFRRDAGADSNYDSDCSSQ